MIFTFEKPSFINIFMKPVYLCMLIFTRLLLLLCYLQYYYLKLYYNVLFNDLIIPLLYSKVIFMCVNYTVLEPTCVYE